jgi:hypothetical protein
VAAVEVAVAAGDADAGALAGINERANELVGMLTGLMR